MIKEIFIFILAALLIFVSCKKDSKTPACIDTKVNEF